MPISRLLLLNTWFLGLSFFCHSQVQYDTSLLKILLSDTSVYKKFNCRSPLIWDDKVKQVGDVVKVRDTLFYLPDQYGAVFTARLSGDSIDVKRIDKTIFAGYNGGHYCFYYKDKLYSFGGYGVWRTNGQLRTFIRDKQEWDIVTLDKEVPSYNEFTYFDSRTGNLWLGQQDYVNQVLTSDHFKSTNSITQLDMSTRTWANLGEFQNLATFRDYASQILCETNFGALVYAPGPSFQILDFPNNKRYQLNEVSDSLLFHAKPEAENYLNFFYINNSILAYNYDKKKIQYQVYLDPAKLSVSSTPVYKLALPRWYEWLLGIITILLIATSVAFLWFRKTATRKRVLMKEGNGAKYGPIPSFLESLSPIELEILNKIRSDTEQEHKTQTNDLNRLLGTDKKTLEVQKTQRSKVLTGINSKFSAYYKTKIIFIDKIRSEEDRRVVEYFVSEEAMQLLAKENILSQQ